MMKIPVIDLSECTLCGICAEICPSVFRLNSAGYIEVIDLSNYPEADVLDAIKNCPASCIRFDD